MYKANLDETQTGYDIVQDSVSKRIIIIGNQDAVSGGSANVLVLDSIGNLIIQKGQGSGTQFFGDGLMNLIQTKDKNFIASGAVEYPSSDIRAFLVKFDTNANVIFGKEYDTLGYDNAVTRVAELGDGSLITGVLWRL